MWRSAIEIDYCNIINALDINECSTNNGGCAHGCTNTIGSYHCTCLTGYILASDQRACNGKYKVSVIVVNEIINFACRHK